MIMAMMAMNSTVFLIDRLNKEANGEMGNNRVIKIADSPKVSRSAEGLLFKIETLVLITNNMISSVSVDSINHPD